MKLVHSTKMKCTQQLHPPPKVQSFPTLILESGYYDAHYKQLSG